MQEELYDEFLKTRSTFKNDTLNKTNFFADYTNINSIFNNPNLLLKSRERKENIYGKWYSDILKKAPDLIESSSKTKVLLEIIRNCELVKDKLVIFSRSLNMLDIIEEVLEGEEIIRKKDSSYQFNTFRKNMDYFRIDGNDSTQKRSQYIDEFNNVNNKRARLFLISMKAGKTGINLVAANRTVIYEASWNPSGE